MLTMPLLQQISNTEINRRMLNVYLQQYRHMLEDAPRLALVEHLAKRGVFYVPFPNYIQKQYGYNISQEFSEYYRQGVCMFNKSLCIPLVTVLGDVLGLIINNPDSDVKYRYPDTQVFKKERYVQVTSESLERANELGVIILVEGVFDELSLSAHGYPVVGMGGSSISSNIAKILNAFPVKVICSDEDAAGKKMYLAGLKYFTGNIVSCRLPTELNDIDNYMRTELGVNTFKERFDSFVSNKLFQRNIDFRWQYD